MDKYYIYLADVVKLDKSKIGYEGPIDPNSANSVLQGILNVVYMWAAIAAVIVIIISALYIINSRDDASRVAQGRHGVIAACVGLVIVLMAFVITNFILGKVN